MFYERENDLAVIGRRIQDRSIEIAYEFDSEDDSDNNNRQYIFFIVFC